MEFFFGSALFDYDMIQNSGHQLRTNPVLKGEVIFQGGLDFIELLGGYQALFFLGF